MSVCTATGIVLLFGTGTVANPDRHPAAHGNSQYGTWLYCDLIECYATKAVQEREDLTELKTCLLPYTVPNRSQDAAPYPTPHRRILEIMQAVQALEYAAGQGSFTEVMINYTAQNDTEQALFKELRNTGCQSFPNACRSICGKNEVLNELLGTTCSQEISRKIDGIRSFKPNALSAALPDFTLRLRGGAEEDFKVFLMYSRK